MDPKMSADLDYLVKKVDSHDELLVKVAEAQVQIANQNSRLDEYIIRNDKRVDKLESSTGQNRDKWIMILGGCSAVISAIGVMFILYQLLQPAVP